MSNANMSNRLPVRHFIYTSVMKCIYVRGKKKNENLEHIIDI